MTETRYYQTSWGAQVIADTDDVFDIPSDWVEVDQSTFAALAADINADREAWVARVAAAKDDKARAVKAELKALGLSEDAIKYILGSN